MVDAEESYISYRELEQLSNKDRLREYLKEAYKRDGTRSFNGSCSTRTGIGFKMEEVLFRLDINTEVLWWNWLLREVVEAPSAEIFMVRLEQLYLAEDVFGHWRRQPLKVPPNPNSSVMFRSWLTINFEEKDVSTFTCRYIPSHETYRQWLVFWLKM